MSIYFWMLFLGSTLAINIIQHCFPIILKLCIFSYHCISSQFHSTSVYACVSVKMIYNIVLSNSSIAFCASAIFYFDTVIVMEESLYNNLLWLYETIYHFFSKCIGPFNRSHPFEIMAFNDKNPSNYINNRWVANIYSETKKANRFWCIDIDFIIVSSKTSKWSNIPFLFASNHLRTWSLFSKF